MQRRYFLAGIAALGGCGFQLRQAPEFAFDSIAIPGTTSSVANELRRTLASVGTVRVAPPQGPYENVQVIRDMISDVREKVVVGLNASGQVREFQLRSKVNFRLRTPQGRLLIPQTEIVQQRDISFNESAVLAKEAEEGLLYRDMQTDLVQQLMRRLAAVKTI